MPRDEPSSGDIRHRREVGGARTSGRATSSDQPDDGPRRTTDPALVRGVVEDRDGYPHHAPGSDSRGDRGLLRIGRRSREEDVTEISWAAFAEAFAETALVFVSPDDGDDAAGIDAIGELRERSDP